MVKALFQNKRLRPVKRKTKSTGFSFKFWLFLLFGGAITLFLFEKSLTGPTGVFAGWHFSDEHPKLVKTYRLAKIYFRDKKWQKALKYYQRFTDNGRGKKEVPRDFMMVAHMQQARIHHFLFQFITAEREWNQARIYATKKQNKQITLELFKLSSIIEAKYKEKGMHQMYFYYQNAGSAKNLKSSLALVYFFLEDSGLQGWNITSMNTVKNAVYKATDWIMDQASLYGEDLRISSRFFAIDRHPKLKSLSIKGGNEKSSFYTNKRFVKTAIRSLGYKSVKQFINEIADEESASNVAILVHLNRKDRSYAMPCIRRCSFPAEFAFIFKKARRYSWDSISQTVAHELLHLVGAGDLYRLEAADSYATTDIMNSHLRYINLRTIEPITAFAVGLQDKIPSDLPFEMVN